MVFFLVQCCQLKLPSHSILRATLFVSVLLDSSGMKMYYTSQLREFDQEVIMTGQTDLTIPPLTRETSIEGTCPESCTRTMPHSVNVMYANLHMHYLGKLVVIVIVALFIVHLELVLFDLVINKGIE